jgi:hypothetical protein
MTPYVYIAVPCYDTLACQILPGLCMPSQDAQLQMQVVTGSLLANVFNRLWCDALNKRGQGLTHFAMHHADIQAPPGWLDTLLNEQARFGADVLSVVVPIKDQRGLTSTGTRNLETGSIRRLTMQEVFKLPETFALSDLPHGPDDCLLINTGLWLCDFTRPWVQEVCFTILDVIQERNGAFVPITLPEDWNFSSWCARRGLRVFATRKVPVQHHGRAHFGNESAWGTWQTEQND